MYLTHRAVQPDDLAEGFLFAQERHKYPESMRKDVLKIWSLMLENGNAPMVIAEDRDQPVGQRMVAFGTSIFAYDWFVDEATRTLPPFLDRQIIALWKAGKRPFLLKNEIVPAQLDGGLNAVAFSWGWDEKRYSPEDSHKIGSTQSQSYVATVAQYKLKQFVQEVFGAVERDRMMNFGVDLCRDHADYAQKEGLTDPLDTRWPYLMRIQMEAVRKTNRKGGTVADYLARLGPSRYRFNCNEQEVLKRALMGATDEEIAETLNLTEVTVKRRWQMIYSKVIEVDPEILGSDPELRTISNDAPKQRRRFLLQALKDHPEEMWPNPSEK